MVLPYYLSVPQVTHEIRLCILSSHGYVRVLDRTGTLVDTSVGPSAFYELHRNLVLLINPLNSWKPLLTTAIANPFDVEESTVEEIERAINVNLVSHFWTVKCLLPAIRKSPPFNGLPAPTRIDPISMSNLRQPKLNWSCGNRIFDKSRMKILPVVV